MEEKLAQYRVPVFTAVFFLSLGAISVSAAKYLRRRRTDRELAEQVGKHESIPVRDLPQSIREARRR
ncbi:MAG: hypothetical protein A3K06_02145 [Candidatus Doudnabacteria bacterium RIFCSPHIGHO2_01_52_17]|uniref:Transmembrane protein n=1 Tax=Candidatus Doudnabacteria bacterium RIFCSPHIGHO2_01_52_17 TaxID=1817820 RepID=A0A1F5NBD0_9BACT|nr:MAG: hypothetical protein A3K06_02145 [Candidatus Doudnabacteria bacterium RIFCSPHIGHO2_01_52_17]